MLKSRLALYLLLLPCAVLTCTWFGIFVESDRPAAGIEDLAPRHSIPATKLIPAHAANATSGAAFPRFEPSPSWVTSAEKAPRGQRPTDAANIEEGRIEGSSRAPNAENALSDRPRRSLSSARQLGQVKFQGGLARTPPRVRIRPRGFTFEYYDGSPTPDIAQRPWVDLSVDAAGRFAFDRYAGLSYELLVDASPLAPVHTVVRASTLQAPPAPIVIQMQSPLTVRGRVVDISGAPIVGALVASPQPTGRLTTRTDRLGAFELVGLPPSYGVLEIAHPNYATLLEPIRQTLAVGGVLELALTLQPGSVVLFRLPGEVNLEGSAGPLRLRIFDAVSGIVALDEAFRDGALPEIAFGGVTAEGRYVIWVHLGSRLLSALDLTGREALDRSIVVLEVGTPWDLSGRCTDLSGAPLSNVVVSLVAEDIADPAARALSTRHVRTDSGGLFQFESLSSSLRYRIEAAHDAGAGTLPEYAHACLSGVGVPDGDPVRHIEIPLAPAGTLVFRVRNEQGEIPTGVVSLIRMEGSAGLCFELRRSAPLIEGGYVIFAGLPPGSGRLTIQAQGYREYVDQLVLSPGESRGVQDVVMVRN